MQCNQSKPRQFRAALCAALLLSENYAFVNANTWATGRVSRSLAAHMPGGRYRENVDFKAMKREAEEEIARREKEKKEALSKKLQDLEQEVEDEREAEQQQQLQQEVGVEDTLPTAAHSLLELDAGTPQALAVTVGKVVVLAGVGFYGARKVIEFARAKLKKNKEAGENASSTLASKIDEVETAADGVKGAIDEAAAEVDEGFEKAKEEAKKVAAALEHDADEEEEEEEDQESR